MTIRATVRLRPSDVELGHLPRQVAGVDLDHELALVELVEPAQGGGLEVRHATDDLAADPQRRALQ